MNEQRRGTLRGWIELFRPPNLFTVPGDVLAGAALAGAFPFPGILLGILVSLFLYGAGLLLNDYCDRHVDERERPGRPIPSGRVNPTAALAVSGALMTAATALAFFCGATAGFIALALAASVVIYSILAREIPVTGFLIMGLCRGLNLFLGAVVTGAAFPAVVFWAAGIEAAYIVSVTALAGNGTTATPRPAVRWLPFVLLFSLFPLAATTGRPNDPSLFIIVLLFWTGATLLFKGRSPAEMPDLVGRLIQGLVLLQAVFVAMAPLYGTEKAVAGGGLAVCFFAAQLVARRLHGI